MLIIHYITIINCTTITGIDTTISNNNINSNNNNTTGTINNL